MRCPRLRNRQFPAQRSTAARRTRTARSRVTQHATRNTQRARRRSPLPTRPPTPDTRHLSLEPLLPRLHARRRRSPPAPNPELHPPVLPHPVRLSLSSGGEGRERRPDRSTTPSLRSSQLRLGFDVAASGQGDLAAFYIDEFKDSALWLRALL